MVFLVGHRRALSRILATGSPKSIGPGAHWRCPGGDSVGSKPEKVPAALEHGAAWVGKVGAPPTPEEFCVPSQLVGFRDSCAVSSTLGVGVLVTFGDSPPTEALLVEESGLISWGTLHRG
jgi:hypothetical protein